MTGADLTFENIQRIDFSDIEVTGLGGAGWDAITAQGPSQGFTIQDGQYFAAYPLNMNSKKVVLSEPGGVEKAIMIDTNSITIYMDAMRTPSVKAGILELANSAGMSQLAFTENDVWLNYPGVHTTMDAGTQCM